MSLLKTPLNEKHKNLGGRMVPFAGWEMPVQYSSIIEEHTAVRERAGLFDVSHMGEILVKGDNAIAFLDSLTCNRVSDMKDGQVQYNAVLNENGGLVDDITIYRIASNDFFVVSNASNHESVTAHFQKHVKAGVHIENVSNEWHQIAIQGPSAENILSQLIGTNLAALYYYRFHDFSFQGQALRISRTGYTGEDGFEVYSGINIGVSLWDKLLESGKANGLIPAGLGARDSLRLEAMFPLYGHELNDTWTPVESGIGWIAKEKDAPYLGYEKIISHKKNGPPGRVVPFRFLEGGVPREGYPVFAGGNTSGKVLSGAHSPILKCGIGTTYLPTSLSSLERIEIGVRDKKVPAAVTQGAFVKGTAGVGKKEPA